MNPQKEATPDEFLDYAGFRPRFLASLVDGLVLLVLACPGWIFSRVAAASSVRLLAVYALGVFLPLVYEVFFHASWGQTIGKRVTQIKVLTRNFRPIGWTKAIARSSVSILFGVLAIVLYTLIWGTISSNTLSHLTIAEALKLKPPMDSVPQSYLFLWATIRICNNFWFWSEVIVMLTNTKKRALHDFIAGTVVIETVEHRSGAPEDETTGQRG